MTLPLGLLTAGSALWSPDALVRGLGIALLSSAIPYSLELMALRHLRSGTFGVLLSLNAADDPVDGLAAQQEKQKVLAEEAKPTFEKLRKWAMQAITTSPTTVRPIATG